MGKRFEVVFLPEAVAFMDRVGGRVREKIYYNIRKAQVLNDPELFKKITEDIWEFRTRYESNAYRLFAFWDKSILPTVVVATHGSLKKTQKTPASDIARAERIRAKYYYGKNI